MVRLFRAYLSPIPSGLTRSSYSRISIPGGQSLRSAIRSSFPAARGVRRRRCISSVTAYPAVSRNEWQPAVEEKGIAAAVPFSNSCARGLRNCGVLRELPEGAENLLVRIACPDPSLQLGVLRVEPRELSHSFVLPFRWANLF